MLVFCALLSLESFTTGEDVRGEGWRDVLKCYVTRRNEEIDFFDWALFVSFCLASDDGCCDISLQVNFWLRGWESQI
jgi:hypothetical protein